MKLFATDLDGTLLNSNHEISKENADALKLAQQNGVEICIASGRIHADVSTLCDKIGIKPHIISNNGALVFSKEGKKLKSWTIDKNHVEYMFDWLTENEYFYEICTDKNLFLPHNTEALLKNSFNKAQAANPSLKKSALNDMIELVYSQSGVKLVKSKDDILNSDLDICSITAVSFDKEKLKRDREYWSNCKDLSMVVSNEFNFEFTNKDASKGNSLEYLANYLDISLDNTAAIGDNYNDLSMLKKAHISIAMGNAASDIKHICKHVSLSNDLNGVAHIISKLMEELKIESTPA